MESHSLSNSNLLHWSAQFNSKSEMGIELDLDTLLSHSPQNKIHDLLNSESSASIILIGQKNNKNEIIYRNKLAVQ